MVLEVLNERSFSAAGKAAIVGGAVAFIAALALLLYFILLAFTPDVIRAAALLGMTITENQAVGGLYAVFLVLFAYIAAKWLIPDEK